MKRIKLIVAYDGTNYCGWQIQNNGRTIEEVLNEALTALLHEKVAVIGASRTDSGVHAERTGCRRIRSALRLIRGFRRTSEC